MRKQIKLALLILCFTLPLLALVIYHSGKNIHTMSRGNYFFSNTRHNVNVEKIILKFNNSNIITLVQREGFWRIKEADDYFVSPVLMRNLIDFINNTVIYRSDKINKENIAKHIPQPIELTTFDSNGKILDSAFIALRKEHNLYHYATKGDSAYLYQLNGRIALSPLFMDWVQMPFLQIDEDEIRNVTTDNFTVYRRFNGDKLKSVETNEIAPNFQRLINNLHILTATEIKHAVHFDTSSFQKKKHYDITLLNGLVYSIDIYYKDNEYWLNVKPSISSISSGNISDILDRHQLLLSGWFFKIDTDRGQIISEFIL